MQSTHESAMPFSRDTSEKITKVRQLIKQFKESCNPQFIAEAISTIRDYSLEITDSTTSIFYDFGEVPEDASISSSVLHGQTILDAILELSKNEALNIFIKLLQDESGLDHKALVDLIKKSGIPEETDHDKCHKMAVYLLKIADTRLSSLEFAHPALQEELGIGDGKQEDTIENDTEEEDPLYYHPALPIRYSSPIAESPPLPLKAELIISNLLTQYKPGDDNNNFSLICNCLDEQYQSHDGVDALNLFEALHQRSTEGDNSGQDRIAPEIYRDMNNYLLHYLVGCDVSVLTDREIKALLEIIRTATTPFKIKNDVLKALSMAYIALIATPDEEIQSLEEPDDLDNSQSLEEPDDLDTSRGSGASMASIRSQSTNFIVPDARHLLERAEDLLNFLDECKRRLQQLEDQHVQQPDPSLERHGEELLRVLGISDEREDHHEDPQETGGDNGPDDGSDSASNTQGNEDNSSADDDTTTPENQKHITSNSTNPFQEQQIITLDLITEHNDYAAIQQHSKEYKEWVEAMSAINMDNLDNKYAYAEINITVDIEDAPDNLIVPKILGIVELNNYYHSS